MQQASTISAAQDLSMFFDVSLDMLCIRDMNGRFVKLSRSWEAVLGYSIEELEGAPLLPLVHPDDVAATRDQMERIKVDGEVVGFINRYRHREGRYRHLEWRARLSGDRVFAVARDVTERLAFEAELKAAKHAAEAANQTKSDFLANMSHEIRTPLNGVIGVVAALGQTELTSCQREMVDLIQGAGVTLERLVSDILDVSKIEAGLLDIETHAFDLGEELRHVLGANQLRAEEKGLSFQVEYGPAARGEFLGDSTRIKQVLGNLLSNAVKFTSQGEVAVGIEVADPQSAGEASRLSIEVRDTGVGFDATATANLFERFGQADTTITRRFGGTGLGLSICRSLVEMMGGEIHAQSEPGRGSVFRAALPLVRSLSLEQYDARRAASHGASPRVEQRPPVLEGDEVLRILLAEDHPINQKVVQIILAPYGAEVTIAENGVEAVDAFKAGAFDLVLMDMQMPVVDGLAATRAIRQYEALDGRRPHTPIVMLSANAMQQHQRDALAAGADLHMAKPITAASLIAGIDKVMHAMTDPVLAAG